MRLEGSLDAFSLPDILQLLSFTRKTGALHLQRAGAGTGRTGWGVAYVREGLITAATADVRRQGLARRIVAAGLVDDDALRAAVDRSAADPTVGVARALREAEAVDPDALLMLAAEQCLDGVFDLMRWVDGEFSFAVDAANPDDVGVARPVDELVAEAHGRLARWAEVTAALPAPDTVLAVAPEPAAEPALSRAEWTLLALVDGRRTVSQVVDLTGRGEFAVVEALASLVERGLLRPLLDGDEALGALPRRLGLLAPLEPAYAGASTPATGTGDAPAGPVAVVDGSGPDGAGPHGAGPHGAGPDGAGADDPAPETSALDAGESTPIATVIPLVEASSSDGGGASGDAPSAQDPVAEAADAAEPSTADSAKAQLGDSAEADPLDAASGQLSDDAEEATSAAGEPAVPSLAPPAIPAPRADDGPRAVTPARPEHVLPARRPDHPDDVSAPLTTVGQRHQLVGATALADPTPTGSPYVERDPSINRSLLLRLIAGVRGL